ISQALSRSPAWNTRSRDSRRESDQSRARSPRKGFRRPIPCAKPPDSARSEGCVRLRHPELEEACAGCARSRPAFIGGMVPGLAERSGGDASARARACPADVVGAPRLEAPWTRPLTLHPEDAV